MAGLGSLLNKPQSGASPDNSNANTGTSDSNANVTAENAAGNATSETDEGDDSLNGTNQRLSPDTSTVGQEESGDQQPVLIATSAPIQRFKIGRFQFDRAVLNLYSEKDAEEFRKLVKGLPPVDRNQIRIIDKEAAEAMVRPIEPGATKQFDSSVGRQREVLGTGDKVIGDNPLDASVGGQGERFAKTAQMDANRPVDGVDSKNVVNDVNQGAVQSEDQIKDQQAANESLSGDRV